MDTSLVLAHVILISLTVGFCIAPAIIAWRRSLSCRYSLLAGGLCIWAVAIACNLPIAFCLALWSGLLMASLGGAPVQGVR